MASTRFWYGALGAAIIFAGWQYISDPTIKAITYIIGGYFILRFFK